MRGLLARFIGDQNATTAIEYGLIAALVAGVMIAGLTQLGNSLNSQMISTGQHRNQPALTYSAGAGRAPPRTAPWYQRFQPFLAKLPKRSR